MALCTVAPCLRLVGPLRCHIGIERPPLRLFCIGSATSPPACSCLTTLPRPAELDTMLIQLSNATLDKYSLRCKSSLEIVGVSRESEVGGGAWGVGGGLAGGGCVRGGCWWGRTLG